MGVPTLALCRSQMAAPLLEMLQCSSFAVCVVRVLITGKNRAVNPSNSLTALALSSSQVNPLPQQFHLPRLCPDLPDVSGSPLALFISGFLGFTQVIVQAVTFQDECLGTLCSVPRSSISL